MTELGNVEQRLADLRARLLLLEEQAAEAGIKRH